MRPGGASVGVRVGSRFVFGNAITRPSGGPTTRYTLAVLAILLGVVSSTMAGIRLFERPRAVSPDDAIAAFRGDADGVRTLQPDTIDAAARGRADQADRQRVVASPSSVAAAPPAASSTDHRPREGVYLYRTTGGERTDLFAGADHPYPETTAVTVRHSGCGWGTEWEPVAGRRNLRSYCADASGIRLATLTATREFFNVRSATHHVCSDDTYLVPLGVGGAPARDWAGSCESEHGHHLEVSGRLLEVGTSIVSGRAIDTLRIAFDMRGTYKGQVREFASIVTIDARSGLLVSLSSSGGGPFTGPYGPGDYTEQYTLELLDPEPRT